MNTFRETYASTAATAEDARHGSRRSSAGQRKCQWPGLVDVAWTASPAATPSASSSYESHVALEQNYDRWVAAAEMMERSFLSRAPSEPSVSASNSPTPSPKSAAPVGAPVGGRPAQHGVAERIDVPDAGLTRVAELPFPRHVQWLLLSGPRCWHPPPPTYIIIIDLLRPRASADGVWGLPQRPSGSVRPVVVRRYARVWRWWRPHDGPVVRRR